MKILLANYRYFVSGGPERYMFSVIEALAGRGHEIIPFSIHYHQNIDTPYAKYFVEPLGTRDEVYFRQQKWVPRTLWSTLHRLFYARDVERSVVRLAADTQPQIAYLLHYLRKLSPSLLVGLNRSGIPIVVRLSDYAMLCPQAHFLRNGTPCELCTEGNLWPSIRYRCLQKSFAVSTLNALATWYHRFQRYFDLIDVFVTTNQFMFQKMVSAGYDQRRLRCIPTFVNGNLFRPSPDFVKDDYIVYAGRLEQIKGVHILLQAVARLRSARPDIRLALKIAGAGNNDYTENLKHLAQMENIMNMVQFLGDMNTDALSSLLSRARVSIVPSLCYENLPNALLESYACGTPVLVSRLGTLVENVQEETGFLFEPGNAEQLAERLAYCCDHPDRIAAMSRKARHMAETLYSSNRHLEALETLFIDLVNRQNAKDHLTG